jgi:putative membrane protein
MPAARRLLSIANEGCCTACATERARRGAESRSFARVSTKAGDVASGGIEMRKEFCAFFATAVLAAPAFAGSDAEFLKDAANGGMLEVKLGEHAERNAASPDVKAFGKRMVDDHSKANRELAALASKEGIAIPTELDEEHAAMAKKLLAEAGPTFDRDYMAMMVEDHEAVVKAFKDEAKDGKTDVDRWAAQTVPTLESHLAMARNVEKKLAAK